MTLVSSVDLPTEGKPTRPTRASPTAQGLLRSRGHIGECTGEQAAAQASEAATSSRQPRHAVACRRDSGCMAAQRRTPPGHASQAHPSAHQSQRHHRRRRHQRAPAALAAAWLAWPAASGKQQLRNKGQAGFSDHGTLALSGAPADGRHTVASAQQATCCPLHAVQLALSMPRCPAVALFFCVRAISLSISCRRAWRVGITSGSSRGSAACPCTCQGKNLAPNQANLCRMLSSEGG